MGRFGLSFSQLAECFGLAKAVNTDLFDAAFYYRKAVDSNCAPAMVRLSHDYEKGVETIKGERLTVELYTRAVLLDCVFIQTALPSCYHSGRGLEKAHFLHQKCCRLT